VNKLDVKSAGARSWREELAKESHLMEHDARLRGHESIDAYVGADERSEDFCVKESLKKLNDGPLGIYHSILWILSRN
jgi:hypothetical protein